MAIELKDYIPTTPDFPKEGILFYNTVALLNSPDAFKEALNRFEKYFRDQGVTRIAAIDSRGFTFGGALADRMNLPLAVVRKKGKLPPPVKGETYDLEYGTDTLEINDYSIAKGDKVGIIDDLLATGGTLRATCKLIEKLDGEVAAVAVLVELTDLKGRDKIEGYPFLALINYDQ